MTLQQLSDLDEQELCMALFIVNVMFPPCCPKMEFEPRHLTWFKHDMLRQKLLDAFPKVLPEAHPIYSSLLTKLSIQHEIRKNIVPPMVLPDTSSITSATGSAITGMPFTGSEFIPTGSL